MKTWYSKSHKPPLGTPSGVAETGRRDGRETQEALARLHSARVAHRSAGLRCRVPGVVSGPIRGALPPRKMQIDVSPEAINKMVSEAIIQSAIGVQLNKVIESEVAKLSRTYDNPIEPVIRQHIHSTISTLVDEKYKAQLKTFIESQLTEEMMRDLFEKMWKAFLGRY